MIKRVVVVFVFCDEKKLFYRLEFPEIKPDSFFKLFGGQRLVIGKRAEEFVRSNDYDDQYN